MVFRRGDRGAVWRTGLLATSLLWPVPAAMAQGEAVQRAQAAQRFDIPAQPLRAALVRFSELSGLQVFFDASIARGIASPGVSGTMAPSEALGQLLAGTPLTYQFTNPTTVTLVRRPATGSDAQLLPPVTVASATSRETATGPVAGYVATRSATGSKTDTPLLETPQAITVITRDQIEARGALTVTEALRYTAGVFTQPFGADGRYDQTYVRGFTATNYGDYRDGLRQPVVNFAGFRTEPYGLERLEVLKGPSSVLYGQAQPGGIINRVTKMPTAEPFREVVLDGGTHDRMQGSVDLSGALDQQGQFLGRIVGVWREADHPLFYGHLPNDRRYLAPSLTWRPSADTSLTLLASYQKDDTFTFKNFSKALPAYPAGFPQAFRSTYVGEPSWDRFEQEQTTIGYRLEHRFDETWTVRQNLRYGHSSTDFRQLEIASLNAAGAIGRSPRRWQEDLGAITVDNQVQANFVTGPVAHKLLVGLDYQTLDWKQEERFLFNGAPGTNLFSPIYGQSVAMPPVVGRTGQKLDQHGLYGQDQVRFAEKWLLTFGGRYDWARLENENRLTGASTTLKNEAFSGRLGLIYLSEIGLAPYLSYSESFLPTTGTSRLGNAFDPTRGRQYEVGIKYQPHGVNSFITLSAFHLTQRNVLTPDPVNPAFSVQTGEVESRGIEIEGVANLGFGLDITAAMALMDAEVTKSNSSNLGKTPMYAPRRTASLWGDYTIQRGPLAGFGFGAGIRYVDETYIDAANTGTNPSMTFVDAAAHYDLGRAVPSLDGVRLAVNATNLFDRDYAPCASNTCYLMDGRTVLASVRYRW